MRKSAPWLLMVFLLTTFRVSTAQAQAAPAPTATLETEVANLTRSLQELVVILRENVGRQQTDLLLKRVELGYMKVGPLQQERKDLRARRAADDEELKPIQAVLAARQTVETQDPAKPEDPEAAIGKVFQEANVKRLKGRISEADQRLAELDSELQQEERNLQHWETLIDQRLDRH
jgi:hypothetical protein